MRIEKLKVTSENWEVRIFSNCQSKQTISFPTPTNPAIFDYNKAKGDKKSTSASDWNSIIFGLTRKASVMQGSVLKTGSSIIYWRFHRYCRSRSKTVYRCIYRPVKGTVSYAISGICHWQTQCSLCRLLDHQIIGSHE